MGRTAEQQGFYWRDAIAKSSWVISVPEIRIGRTARRLANIRHDIVALRPMLGINVGAKTFHMGAVRLPCLPAIR